VELVRFLNPHSNPAAQVEPRFIIIVGDQIFPRTFSPVKGGSPERKKKS
jgi:hypothetical protein